MVLGVENEIKPSSPFSPGIRRFIDTLVTDGRFGVCPGEVKVSQPKSGCLSTDEVPKCDRFKLTIPYAGDTITWEVIFDCTHPSNPPDFIFGVEDEGFYPNIEDIQSLVMWNPQDVKGLIYVVEELLQHYRQFQLSLLEGSRLQFEYTHLIEHTSSKAEDIELIVSRNENRIGPVNFLIKLDLDLSKIPPILSKDFSGTNSAVLLVSYSTPEGYRVSPQLFLSPAVESALGGSLHLRIPSFSSGETLFDYVPSVYTLLKNKIKHVVDSFEKREEYVSAFIAHYGRSVLEYDKASFSTMAFLFEWNDFYFIFRIELPSYFPKEQPVFYFQSIYHETKGKPYMEMFQDYPYSPRWSGNEMAERARLFILDKIGAFQKASVLA
ncbi:hypothetical protein LOTGIDRAFT_236527 [Lottia gigantea]|uniref:BRISC and BRCA1-A complex member 2 n=1 Tax=Lottia gigantea TaxID=225164 RepID=V3ZRI7_LOTGI|nr:hypothetical protein LOTGIDRAFT_236527 [Lottia gigantea]ESO83491.1 hypothetical protein LOTGIDRAFT_236527 [Lottia gigantea]